MAKYKGKKQKKKDIWKTNAIIVNGVALIKEMLLDLEERIESWNYNPPSASYVHPNTYNYFMDEFNE